MTMLDETASGVFVIAVTPFHDDGSLDLESVDRMVDFYQGCGVAGVTLLGMMGEAGKLTATEAREVADRVLRRLDGALPVVVGVSAPGLARVKELSDTVMDLGASGVMAAPPGGLKTDDSIAGYYRMLGERLGETPFVVQDFPLSTGVQFAPAVIDRIIDEVPNCVMLKHEDWPGLNKIEALRDSALATGRRRVSILSGMGGLYLPEELSRGADGAMTGFAYTEMMVNVCAAHAEGDTARAHDIFDTYLPLVRYEQQPGIGLAIRKYTLARRGAIASRALRSPGPKLSGADIADIESLLARQERALEAAGLHPDRAG